VILLVYRIQEIYVVLRQKEDVIQLFEIHGYVTEIDTNVTPADPNTSV
jgi:hypothetical protein